MKRLPGNELNIYRVRRHSGRYSAWVVAIGTPNGLFEQVRKEFSDKRNGGREQALDAARAFRDQQRAELEAKGLIAHCPAENPFHRPNRRHDRSVVTGVTVVFWTIRGRTYYRYTASWNENNKHCRKSFTPGRKRTDRQAFEAALRLRRQKELEFYGYTLIELEKFDDYHREIWAEYGDRIMACSTFRDEWRPVLS